MLLKIPFFRKYIENTRKGIQIMAARKEISPISLDDRQFFEEFYEEYKNFMFYSARQYVNSQTECEDIVQDAVERLLRNIATIREIPGCGLRKYIVLTVKASYLDSEKRRHGDIPIYLDDAVIEALVKEEIIAPKDWYDFSSVFDVERLKRELPKRDWFVLEGKYLMGYSQTELGKMIGVSPNSIRMIICRARRKARQILHSK